jgi:hypothetical protein
MRSSVTACSPVGVGIREMALKGGDGAAPLVQAVAVEAVIDDVQDLHTALDAQLDAALPGELPVGEVGLPQLVRQLGLEAGPPAASPTVGTPCRRGPPRSGFDHRQRPL